MYSTIAELFTDRRFIIPEFQRGYAWTDKEAIQLFEDIQKLQRGATHYSGIITLRKRDDEQPEHCYVVDGQQRIVALTLLFRALRAYCEKTDEASYLIERIPDVADVIQYVGNEVCYNTIRHIMEHGSIAGVDQLPNQDQYGINIIVSFGIYIAKLSVSFDGDTEGLERFIDNSRVNLVCHRVYLDERVEDHNVFESVNNRGKKLTTMEILKNRLLTLTDSIANEEGRNALRQQIVVQWQQIYQNLGRPISVQQDGHDGNALQDDELLKYHWLVYYRHDGPESTLKEYVKDLLDNRFGLGRAAMAGHGLEIDLQQYTQSLCDASRHWFSIIYPQDDSEQFHQENNTLMEIRSWLGKVNIAIKMSNERGNYFRALMLAAAMRYGYNQQFLNLLRQIERHIVLVYLLCGCPKNTHRAHFQRKAHEVWTSPLIYNRIINVDVDYSIPAKAGSNFSIQRIRDNIHHEESYRDVLKYTYRYVLMCYEEHLVAHARQAGNVNYSSLVGPIQVCPHEWSDDLQRLAQCYPAIALINRAASRRRRLRSIANYYMAWQRPSNEQVEMPYHQRMNLRLLHPGNLAQNEARVFENENWNSETIDIRGREIISFVWERWNPPLLCTEAVINGILYNT